MSKAEDRSYGFLKWVAIAGAVLWLGYEGYRHFAGMAPGDISYIDGNSLFKDRQYERAAQYFQNSLEADPRHEAALRGLANSYVQLKRYDEALAAIQRAINVRPEFGGNYAIRGIIYDHMGRYALAIADYERALKLDPGVADGMHWLDRLLYNVQKRPPTVADRLAYLKTQLALPESERLLRLPEVDDQQRPYER